MCLASETLLLEVPAAMWGEEFSDQAWSNLESLPFLFNVALDIEFVCDLGEESDLESLPCDRGKMLAADCSLLLNARRTWLLTQSLAYATKLVQEGKNRGLGVCEVFVLWETTKMVGPKR